MTRTQIAYIEIKWFVCFYEERIKEKLWLSSVLSDASIDFHFFIKNKFISVYQHFDCNSRNSQLFRFESSEIFALTQWNFVEFFQICLHFGTLFVDAKLNWQKFSYWHSHTVNSLTSAVSWFPRTCVYYSRGHFIYITAHFSAIYWKHLPTIKYPIFKW